MNAIEQIYSFCPLLIMSDGVPNETSIHPESPFILHLNFFKFSNPLLILTSIFEILIAYFAINILIFVVIYFQEMNK
ncbi:hypothetical protein CHI08_18255 [Peribacillus simplex]|nr:hypothetical protein CHI08_18255 [Peribacillus simplex]